VIVGDNGTVLYSGTGGVSWTKRVSGTVNRLRSVAFIDSKTAIAVGDSMTVVRTTDGGLTWIVQSGSSYSSLYSICYNGSRGVIVGEGGTILSTLEPGVLDEVHAVARSEIPSAFTLSQNYPNPFNPSTAISFQLSAFSYVKLAVFDILGREVTTLVDEARTAGDYTVHWNGSGFPSGVYYYRMAASPITGGTGNSFVHTKKLILLK
jgi:hypothetical protein